jgi:dihydroxyacetone kinase phosphoprotein-dependent L subunit
MTKLSTQDFRAMLLAVAEAVIANEDHLAKADRDIGDGDHGAGMARGFAAAAEALHAGEFGSVRTLFRSYGDTLIQTMGGASGIIFGQLFRAGAKEAGDGGHFSLREFCEYLDRGMQEIMTRGGAGPGDKTMIDALAPAVAALKDAVVRDSDFPSALRAAAIAAAKGREKSRAYVARFGKAATLGERAVGFPDAGAVSTTLIFEAMATWAEAHVAAARCVA